MFSRKALFCFTKTKMTNRSITKKIACITGIIALLITEKAIENYFDKAKEYIKENGFISAVGHQATAQILTELLEVEIPQNRIQAKQEDGQMALVFAMNQRIAEGVILNREEIEQIGYTLNLLEKDI